MVIAPNNTPGLGPLESMKRPTGMPAAYMPTFAHVPCFNFSQAARLLSGMGHSQLGCSPLTRASFELKTEEPSKSTHTIATISEEKESPFPGRRGG